MGEKISCGMTGHPLLEQLEPRLLLSASVPGMHLVQPEVAVLPVPPLDGGQSSRGGAPGIKASHDFSAATGISPTSDAAAENTAVAAQALGATTIFYDNFSDGNMSGWTRGDRDSWRSKNFDLTDVPTLGNVCGESQVWIAFLFKSNGSVTDVGAFVDDVVVSKYTEPQNQDPQLSNGYVTPSSGDTATDFYYYVDYYDPDGDAPQVGQVAIFPENIAWSMSLYSGSASNGTYRTDAINLDVGDDHTYYFYFTDGNGGEDTLPSSGEYSGPTVVLADDAYEENDTRGTAYTGLNEGVWLSSIDGPGIQSDDDWYQINITSGYENLVVNLTFTDADGDIDLEVVDSSGNVVDSSSSTSDDEHIDTILPSSGTYYLRVYYDNAGNTYDLWWDDLQPPNQDPQLSNGYVTPSSGDTATDFYYYVDYYDPDGDAPQVGQVAIFPENIAWSMSLYSGSASDGTYRTDAINLDAGDNHTYYFYFTDGNSGEDRLPSSGEYSGPTVQPPNQDPQLSNGYVTPSSGDTGTDFYYYVDYYDPDGDAPHVGQVAIFPENIAWSMSLYSGSASDGTYRTDAINLDAGDNHTYYFYFTDGNGGSDMSNVVDGPSVNDRPTAWIVSGPSGTIGYDDVTFSWSGSDSDGTVNGYEIMMDDVGWSTMDTSMDFDNLSAAEHTFKVRSIDDDGAYSDWASRTFTIAFPDLTKSTDSVNRTSARPGDTLDATLTVKNTGQGQANAGYVYYYWKKDSVSFDNAYKVGEDSYGALVYNGTSDESFSYVIPTTATPGTYYLFYWIDATNTTSNESREDNNKSQWTITVQPETPPLDVAATVEETNGWDGNPDPGVFGRYIQSVPMPGYELAALLSGPDAGLVDRLAYELGGHSLTDSSPSDGWTWRDVPVDDLSSDTTLTVTAYDDDTSRQATVYTGVFDAAAWPDWLEQDFGGTEFNSSSLEYLLSGYVPRDFSVGHTFDDHVWFLGGKANELKAGLAVTITTDLAATDAQEDAELFLDVTLLDQTVFSYDAPGKQLAWGTNDGSTSLTLSLEVDPADLHVLGRFDADFNFNNVAGIELLGGLDSGLGSVDPLHPKIYIPALSQQYPILVAGVPIGYAELSMALNTHLDLAFGFRAEWDTVNNTLVVVKGGFDDPQTYFEAALVNELTLAGTVNLGWGLATGTLSATPTLELIYDVLAGYEQTTGWDIEDDLYGEFYIPFEISGSALWGYWEGTLYEGRVPDNEPAGIGPEDVWTFWKDAPAASAWDAVIAVEAPTEEGDGPGTFSAEPILGRRSDGAVFMGYVADPDPDDGVQAAEILVKQRHANGTWSEPIQVSSGADLKGSPALGFDANGDCIVAWVQASGGADLLESLRSWEIYWATVDVDGGVASTPARLTDNGAVDSGPAMAVSDGAGFLAWQHFEESDNTWRTRHAVWDGAGFIGDSGIDGANAYDFSLRAATNTVGDAMAVWVRGAVSSDTLSADRVMTAVWEGASGTFTKVETIAAIQDEPRSAAVAFVPDGRAVVVWSELAQGGYVLFARTYDPSAGAWGDVQEVMNDAVLDGVNVDVSADGDVALAVCGWAGDAHVWTAWGKTDTSSTWVLTDAADGGQTATEATLAFEQQGDLLLFWMEGPNLVGDTVAKPVPEITVEGNGQDIADGDSTPSAADGTDFGSAVQGQPGPERTFTVYNTGTAPLALGAVTLPDGYSIIEELDDVIPAGGSDTFAVRLGTDTVGTMSGDVSFSTNDADGGDGIEDPFNFPITGDVTPADTTAPMPNPSEWATQPYATGPNSIRMEAVTASDPGGVEYYFECYAGPGHDSQWQDSPVYEDTGLLPGTTYGYRVKARDKSPDLNETGWSGAYAATTLAVPGTPQNVEASNGTFSDKVQVTWDAVDDTTGYEVYRGTASDLGSAAKVGDVTGTVYDDMAAETLRVYWYWVKAENAVGTSDPGGPSAGFRAIGVTASDGEHTDKVHVTWDPVAIATSYEVWRDVGGDGATATLLDETTGLAYDDTTATPGTTYWYWVLAKNDTWTSPFDGCISDAGHRAEGPVLPVVSVVATDPTASEDYVFPGITDRAEFEVRRDIATTENLTINAALSGDADIMDDYIVGVSGVLSRTIGNHGTVSFTLAPGDSPAVVTITPINDLDLEPTETVILTLTPDDDYVLDPVQSDATATIADNDDTPIPGDANLDGIVDIEDFFILKANFDLDPAAWGDGNFNDDTIVDIEDFFILKTHFGESATPAAGSDGGQLSESAALAQQMSASSPATDGAPRDLLSILPAWAVPIGQVGTPGRVCLDQNVLPKTEPTGSLNVQAARLDCIDIPIAGATSLAEGLATGHEATIPGGAWTAHGRGSENDVPGLKLGLDAGLVDLLAELDTDVPLRL